MCRFPRHAGLRLGLIVAAAIVGTSGGVQAEPGKQLDLSGYRLTFEENFDTLDVSAWGPGTRWIAHTPWYGDFGDAKFTDPQPGFPFTIKDGVLRIEARKGEDGKWRSGLLASVDPKFQGFSQQYGYFEIRTMLPAGPGLWPAFWLIGIDRTTHTTEVDIFEHHGHMPYRFSSAVQVWDRVDPSKTKGEGNLTIVPEGSLSDRFNTFGALIDPEWVRIYFNREEVWKTPTPPRLHQPMFILLNLAMGSGWPIDKTPNPSWMYVDYVKVWSKSPEVKAQR